MSTRNFVNNDESLTLHITNQCNLKCSHCYLNQKETLIKLEDVTKAVSLLNPKNIFLYGGEPMLYPKTIKEIINMFPKKKFFLITNGTIYNEEIFELVTEIHISLSSFRYWKAIRFRPYTEYQFQSVLKVINNYRSKIVLSHDIYPLYHDENFYKEASLQNLPVDTYPLILPETEYVPYKSYIEHLYIPDPILVKPKFRLLSNGILTRDMTENYNIGHIRHYNKECLDDLRKVKLPVYSKCSMCAYNPTCVGVRMFPAMVLNQFRMNQDKDYHFCKMARYLSEVFK